MRISRYVWMLIVIMSFQLCAAAENATSPSPVEIEDELVGVKAGTSVKALLARYPNLYRHELVMGEVLYEACNQDNLEVFTFVAEPWSKDFITYITTHYAEVSVCRDQTGSLPDLAIAPTTPRGIRLGDAESRVLEYYGAPLRRKPVSAAETILEYRPPQESHQDSVENLVLYFHVREGKVTDMSLQADMPGVKKPF